MIYTNTEFQGWWPVGTAAVVSADSREEAALRLEATLDRVGLSQAVLPEDMKAFDPDEVLILCDGNY